MSSSNQPTLLSPRLTLEGNRPSFSNRYIVVLERPVTAFTSLNRIILKAISLSCYCEAFCSVIVSAPADRSVVRDWLTRLDHQSIMLRRLSIYSARLYAALTSFLSVCANADSMMSGAKPCSFKIVLAKDLIPWETNWPP